MECMCAQTRPLFILSSERVLGNGVRTHVNSEEKTLSTATKFSTEEDGTHDSTSSRTAGLAHLCNHSAVEYSVNSKML